jgi:DNA-directed RNA polymerase specialized sigma24 family protein
VKVKEEIGNRAEKILALLLLNGMKGATKAEKAVQLSVAGFTAVEIADLLETNAAAIHQYLYTMRRKKKK